MLRSQRLYEQLRLGFDHEDTIQLMRLVRAYVDEAWARGLFVGFFSGMLLALMLATTW